MANRGGGDVLEELRLLHRTMKPTFIRALHTVPFRVFLWYNAQLDLISMKQVKIV